MTTQRARRAAATALLSAGALFLVPAAAHADTCMTDDKGNQVCGPSGTGPSSGPGSYTGVGVHDGTPGSPGPNGQPLAAATPPAWMTPGWTPPPLPASAQPAPNGPGVSTGTLAPGQLPPGASGSAAAPVAPQGTKELPPSGATVPAQGSSADAGNPSASASGTATPSASASASPTPVPTMTAMEQHSPPPSAAPAAPVRAQTVRTSEDSSFNPGVLLAVIGVLAMAVGVIWFVPGIRAGAAALLRRGR